MKVLPTRLAAEGAGAALGPAEGLEGLLLANDEGADRLVLRQRCHLLLEASLVAHITGVELYHGVATALNDNVR